MSDLSSTKLAPPYRDEKWETEFRLREREIVVKELEAAAKLREIDARIDEQKKARWSNPLVLAVFAAALAAAGNAGVALINGSAQRELEESRSEAQLELERYKSDAQLALEKSKTLAQQTIEESKAESARILEVIKTADPEKAATNLNFLLRAGLVVDIKRRSDLESFLAQRQKGEGPNIPPASSIPATIPYEFFSVYAVGTVLISGENGDYIAGGETFLLQNPEYIFRVYGYPGDITIEAVKKENVEQVGFSAFSDWTISLSTGENTIFVNKKYINAQRSPFNNPGNPGLSVSGRGRGCNQLSGEYDITEINYDTSGRLSKIKTRVKQNCENGAPSLSADIDISVSGLSSIKPSLDSTTSTAQ